MSYDIVVESSAHAEIDRDYRWMARNLSPETAASWYLEIVEAIESLRIFPARCARAFEDQFFEEDIRQLLCGKHRILFEIDDDTVRILHVRHSARRPLKPKRR